MTKTWRWEGKKDKTLGRWDLLTFLRSYLRTIFSLPPR